MNQYQQYAAQVAKRNGLPQKLFFSLIQAESGWNANARSPVGARGLTQLMPGTARGLGVDPDDWRQNLDGGARYLRQQIDRFGGDYRKAVAAYNAGPGAVQKYGGIPPYKETQAYVQRVLGNMGKGFNTPTTIPAAASPEESSAGPTGGSSPARFQFAQDLINRNAKMFDLPTITMPTPSFAATPFEAPTTPTTTPASGTSGTSAGPGGMVKGTGGYPAGKKGKLIGSPYGGTHSLGNWQSDNAVDIALAIGTPILAAQDGVVSNRFGSLGKGGRFQGLRMSLNGNGQSTFYAHMSKFASGIKPGVKVRRGQIIGYSGSANGVAHLHFGVQNGSPYQYVPK